MDTNQERQHPHAHLFTLRVWDEALGEGEAEWRGRVQEVSSGETGFFQGWTGLVATLTRLLEIPRPGDRPGRDTASASDIEAEGK